MTACPHLADVERLLVSGQDGGELAALEQHVATCADCRQRLETIGDVSDLLPEKPPARSRPSSSKALARAMLNLEMLAQPAEAPSRPHSSVRLNFLSPTDQPGFLGKLGEYNVRRVVGQGGMGVVLEAVDPVLKRTVAIKVLAPWSVADDETQGRFLREAQTAAALIHENVVPIHAVAHSEGVQYLVFEYVAGESLADRLDREGKLPLAEVQRIGAQVANGLAAAHAKGLVHRDLKPANILLAAETGRVKLADFGLARQEGSHSLTLSGTVLGTPEYMAPEQAVGEVADEQSDLFSLGVVLYQCVSGVSPFQGRTLLDTLDNVRACQPALLAQLDPSLPEWFTSLVHRMLSRDPADRPSSAVEVARLLAQSLPAGTVADLPAPQKTIRPKPVGASIQFRPWLFSLLAAGMVVGAVAVVVWYRNRQAEITAAPVPARLQPSRRAPPVAAAGFTVSGSETLHESLSEAIAAAKDDDIIEIHGDGPYLTPPLSIVGKRLTIRAAAGAHPQMLAENPGVSATQGFLTTDSDLRLEGVEIHWSVDSPPGITEADFLGRSIVACTHGRLIVTHCRIVSDRLNCCVGGSCRSVIVRRSHLLAKNGLGIFWRPEAGGGLGLEDCAFENRFGITLFLDRAPSMSAPGTLRLERCTLSADRGMQVILESAPRKPLPLIADHNLFDCEYLFVVLAQRPPRPKFNPSFGEVGGLLKLAIGWSEDANVHRRGMQYLARPRAGRPGDVIPANLVGIDRWRELWDLPPRLSKEGEIRFQPRDDNPMSPPILASIDNVAESLPESGMRPELVGPGKAYHAWRTTADYATWPPRSAD